MNTNIMTPHHPEWPIFYGKLKNHCRECDCEADSIKPRFAWTIEILNAMGADVLCSISMIASPFGITCDCSIIKHAETLERFQEFQLAAHKEMLRQKWERMEREE
jgi:hypothetical protein